MQTTTGIAFEGFYFQDETQTDTTGAAQGKKSK